MPIESLNGVKIYAESHGAAGPPIVLVHGSWGDHHNWDAAVPLLASMARVTTYDRRGHSQSERPPGQGRIRQDVADLAALIEHHHLAPAHVVGNSFGAIVTLNLLIDRPDLVASAAVHEPPLIGLLEDDPALLELQSRIDFVVGLLERGEIQAGARQFVETIAFGPGTWDRLPLEMRQTFLGNAPTWLDEQNDPDWVTIDLERLAATYGGPLMLSRGTRSPAFFNTIADIIADEVPRAQRFTFRDAGHVPHVTHPDDFAMVIGAYVTGVAGAR